MKRILTSLELSANQSLESKLDSLTNRLDVYDYLFLRLSDIAKMQNNFNQINWEVFTKHPIAINSPDHLHPRGVRTDETRSPAFVKNLNQYFNRQVRYLDLGCAGGGLVYDFLLTGNEAIGIEGSDYAILNQRSYWREIPWALFTADLTQPLQIRLDGIHAKFDVIGAWEFFEHIAENEISSVINNIKNHLVKGEGLLLANISTFEDCDDQNHWHQTVRSYSWWAKKFEENGLTILEYPIDLGTNPRGSGNTLGTWRGDYNISDNPNLGFAIAAKYL